MGAQNFKPFPVLKTERLTLRKLVSSDAYEIFALRSDINVNKYLDRKPSKSIDDAKTFIQTINENLQSNHSIYWAMSQTDTDKLIGTICLFGFSDDNLKAEIGYELLPDYQGKGIMDEALSTVIDYGMQHIALTTIEAFTHSENWGSIKLLEKFNFKKSIAAEGNFLMFTLKAKD